MATTGAQLEEGEIAEEAEGEILITVEAQPSTVEAAQPPTSHENTAATCSWAGRQHSRSRSRNRSRSRSRSRSRRRVYARRRCHASFSPASPPHLPRISLTLPRHLPRVFLASTQWNPPHMFTLPRRRPVPASPRPSTISNLISRTSTRFSSQSKSPLSITPRKPPEDRLKLSTTKKCSPLDITPRKLATSSRRAS